MIVCQWCKSIKIDKKIDSISLIDINKSLYTYNLYKD